MAEVKRTILNPHPPIGAYSHAVRVSGGDLLFIAGQVSVENGVTVGEGDVAAQTRQVFANLGSVLDSAGATFADVVEFTTYLVGRESFEPFAEARTEIFPELFPTGTIPRTRCSSSAGLPGRSCWWRSRPLRCWGRGVLGRRCHTHPNLPPSRGKGRWYGVALSRPS